MALLRHVSGGTEENDEKNSSSGFPHGSEVQPLDCDVTVAVVKIKLSLCLTN
jgi:hypothetical protein